MQEKVFKNGKNEKPLRGQGRGVAKSGGDKINSILHTRVLQIKVFQGHYLKKWVKKRYIEYF